MATVVKGYRFDITDILFWLGLVIVALWAIGKAIGLISSPVWVDMVPVFGILITIAGIGLKIGRILQRLDNVIEDVSDIRTELKEHNRRITILETMTARKT